MNDLILFFHNTIFTIVYLVNISKHEVRTRVRRSARNNYGRPVLCKPNTISIVKKKTPRKHVLKTLPPSTPQIRPMIKCVTPLTPAGEYAIEAMTSIDIIPIQREDAWVHVWEKMKYTGWTDKQGLGLLDYIYLSGHSSS